jgi:hypothetical protein
MSAQPTGEVDPVIAALIRRKARRLAQTCRSQRCDERDLRQQLWLEVYSALRRHEPRRATRRTYATKIVTTRSVSIARHAFAQRRDRRRERPLDAVAEQRVDRRLPTPEQVDLRLDVHEAVRRLDDDLRPVAHLFTQHTESEVVRTTGLSRQKVRGMRSRIASALREGGIS